MLGNKKIEEETFEENKRSTIAKYREKIITGILIIILIILGLFSSSIPIYYFGFLFFLVGFFAATQDSSKETLIFLFTHGVLGFGLMLSAILSPIFKSPIASDMPRDLLVTLIIVLAIALIAFLLVIIFKVAKKFETHKAYMPFTLALFTASIFIATFISRLIVPGIF